MKSLTLPLGMTAALLVSAGWGFVNGVGAPERSAEHTATTAREALGAHAVAASGAADVDADEIIQQYCVRCHNERRLRGNLTLEAYDADRPEEWAHTTERMIAKLRAGMMPPPGASRPPEDSLRALVETLEARMDAVAAERPNPGGRTFQRLNRAEYTASIENLLGLEIDAGAFLPLDTKSENFDNIADVQLLSPTLLDAYLAAAAEISRLAIGDLDAAPRDHTYTVSGYTSQADRVEGAPFGTRGGTSVVHTFPADGEYVFTIIFEHTTTGDGFAGKLARGEQVEVSIDGTPVALIDVDSWLSYADPWRISMRTEPIDVRAGPRRVTAAFLTTSEGPVDDLTSPHDWSIADRHTGMAGYGLTLLPHLRDLVIGGPYRVTGISDHPVRDRVFSCRPTSAEDAEVCAGSILERLATRAYRRPLEDRDREALIRFYREGAVDGGFEIGVRTGLQAILASPHFIFRLEEPAERIDERTWAVAPEALASRLSFFLWGGPPDEALLQAAASGRLNDADGLAIEVRRMLADPRAEALGHRFAAQWLRLQDLDKVHPDSYWFPDYDQQLADAMRTETELFFTTLVREDLSLFELYEADWSVMNERLARHYGIDGVPGPDFRRVEYPDARRRGVLGHGSVLTLTSHADRTSPVLRGKWVMEVLMGTPPPPPPPGVPDLDETEAAEDGVARTTAARMEAHRANPTCNSCHRFIDPIGLALDAFDVTGRWRIREHGSDIDTRGELYDGTPIESTGDLVEALMTRPEPLVRTFTQNLMAFALGRRVEAFDQPTIRGIERSASADGYRMSAFVLGVVTSDAFRLQRADMQAETEQMDEARLDAAQGGAPQPSAAVGDTPEAHMGNESELRVAAGHGMSR